MADAVNLFNPRVIAVGGQLATVDEQLLAGIREVVYQRSLPLATRNLQIVRSKLDPPPRRPARPVVTAVS